jgi:multidrug efflux pump subunit AcrB
MEQRITYVNERALTVTVNNIEHIESTSYNGIGVIKVFLQPAPPWIPPWRKSPRPRKPF